MHCVRDNVKIEVFFKYELFIIFTLRWNASSIFNFIDRLSIKYENNFGVQRRIFDLIFNMNFVMFFLFDSIKSFECKKKKTQHGRD